jgi:hypothetical protein
MDNAMRWMRMMLNLVKDGGIWSVPRSHSLYKIHHNHKLAVKMSGEPEPVITQVFNAMGWAVEDLTQPPFLGDGKGGL